MGFQVVRVPPDHGLHAVVFGPDGKYYFNQGNTGFDLTDRSGKAQATFFASCQAGAYAVTATALGSTAQVRFTLTTTSSRSRCTTVIAPR